MLPIVSVYDAAYLELAERVARPLRGSHAGRRSPLGLIGESLPLRRYA
jgi:hypothetical protein